MKPTFRKATVDDTPLLLVMIGEMVAALRMQDVRRVNAEKLHQHVFCSPKIEISNGVHDDSWPENRP